MVQNAYAGGANTSPTPSARGRGNKGGMGTGMAGRKKGNKNTPKGGLYGGKAGSLSANQNPEVYVGAALREAGAYGNAPGSDWEAFLADAGVQNMVGAFGQYNQGVAKNQKLSVKDWMAQQYGGAGYSGKQGQTFSAGTLQDQLAASVWHLVGQPEPAHPRHHHGEPAGHDRPQRQRSVPDLVLPRVLRPAT